MEARDVILRPVITEASMAGVENKVYQFEVDRRATKLDVKRAIKEIFEVEVKKVNIANVRGRNKRMGRYAGQTRRRKKATIYLTADSKAIEIYNQGSEK
jgi:large subunit ribosomal protein L23